jgi:hypothetical protein
MGSCNIFVESNELCEKLCNNEENCVKDCLFLIENHQKPRNVDMIYKSKRRKSRINFLLYFSQK